VSEVIKTHKCPICHKLFAGDAYLPFCSKRCADVDLGRWFNGSYAVASEDLDELEVEELSEALENADKTDM
jgi:endogenous inhibitor of DNA gyrase (YacG/DUF329 family)